MGFQQIIILLNICRRIFGFGVLLNLQEIRIHPRDTVEIQGRARAERKEQGKAAG